MAGMPSPAQLMGYGGLAVGAVALYFLWSNKDAISAYFQQLGSSIFTPPYNQYQQYPSTSYCPQGGVVGPNGLCPNGQPPTSSVSQLPPGTYCADGSVPNSVNGLCANGQPPASQQGYGQPSPYGYPSTSVCNDGSQPNPVNGLCANGSYPSSVGTGVNNALQSPYGQPYGVMPTISGGVDVGGGPTFTDPSTGQTYNPQTGSLLTPGGAYNIPSLSSPLTTYPTLGPLVCPGGTSPDQNGNCPGGATPLVSAGVPQSPAGAPPGTPSPTSPPAPQVPTTPTGQLYSAMCNDGSAPSTSGQCANGQAPIYTATGTPTTATTPNLPVTTVTPPALASAPVPAPVAPAPAPMAPAPVITPSPSPMTTTSQQQGRNYGFGSGQNFGGGYGFGGIPGAGGAGGGGGGGGGGGNTGAPGGVIRSHVGFMSEGAMISAQAFHMRPTDPRRARVFSRSSVRPSLGNSPITSQIFGRKFYGPNRVAVS